MLDARSILALMELPKFGRRSVQIVVRISKHPIEHPADLRQLLEDARQTFPRLTVPSAHEVDDAVSRADEMIAGAREQGLTVIGPNDLQFPRRLRLIPDPPVVLFVRGDLAVFNQLKAVAVIGTREPSKWGRHIGERVAERLAQQGVSVISGLAEGCDTAAHQGCLRGGGKTAAVLAHGLHMIYPASNRALAAKILDSGGCLVSEYPLGMRPQRSYFVERDRLQSGLSDATLVIETDVEGGTMHTIAACLQQRRLLACVSHLPKFENDKSRGNAMLMRRGDAIPISNGTDLDEFIDRLGTDAGKTSSTGRAADQDTLFEE